MRNKQYGIVIFLDILGIKGIWNRRSAAEVLRKWDYLISIYRNLSRQMLKEYSKSKITKSQFIAFSDTIIMTIPNLPTERVLSGLSSTLVSLFSHASGERLFIRGVISFGTYYSSESMVIGPAIDEAYEHHKLLEWCGIAASPSLTRIIRKLEEKGKTDHGFCPYDIPTKNGLEKNGRTLFWTPFDLVTGGKKTVDAAIKKELLKTKDESAVMKLTNTMKFIEYIKQKYMKLPMTVEYDC